jgi:exopolysaccharide biosynthesis WecB/TagA/CpsF family protein
MGLLRDAPARARAIDFAADAHARIILLAVGSPQQEVLAREMREDGRVTGFGLCIGAAVEFITGEQVRAPRIVQRAGVEWAWRLASQPKRLWRRYLVDGPAIFGMVWRWSRMQKAKSGK